MAIKKVRLLVTADTSQDRIDKHIASIRKAHRSLESDDAVEVVRWDGTSDPHTYCLDNTTRLYADAGVGDNLSHAQLADWATEWGFSFGLFGYNGGAKGRKKMSEAVEEQVRRTAGRRNLLETSRGWQPAPQDEDL